jgi:Protein kinase domain
MTQPTRDPWMPHQTGAPATGPTTLLAGYRDFVAVARSESSEVYRARQDGLDRPVAIKVLLLDDPEAIARFQREVDITVQLGRQHPHIVTVIDTGITTTGRPCIVMEYHDLGSVQDRLGKYGPLPWDEVLSVGTVVADALSFAHRHGVLHRDVKPQNILVLPTSYVVADFGIARPIDAARTTSVEWFSFRHASPEVLDGLPPAVVDDIWSVGSTLFTLLDGAPPFATGVEAEDTALAYMRRVRTEPPRALRRPDVPPGLVAIIERCLARNRADRFPDAAALHQALTLLAGQARAWAPADEAATGPPAPATAAGPGTVSQQPLVVPVQPAPLVPRPPPAPTAARPAPEVTRPPLRADPSATATVRGAASPSAMAQLVASAVAAGGYAPGDATGTHTADRYTEPSSVTVQPPRSRPLRRILVAAGAALVIGGVLGIGGTWVVQLTRGGTEQAGPEGPVEQPNQVERPDASTEPAQPTASPPQPVDNPAIAPVITRLEGGTTGVLLEWDDPTQGRAAFAVVQIFTDQPAEFKSELPAGTTQATVDGLDPATAPFCFQVIAFVGGEQGVERGVSDQRCVEPTG